MKVVRVGSQNLPEIPVLEDRAGLGVELEDVVLDGGGTVLRCQDQEVAERRAPRSVRRPLAVVLAADLQDLVVKRVFRQAEGARGATQLRDLDDRVEGAGQDGAGDRTPQRERLALRQLIEPQRPTDGSALVKGDRAGPIDEHDGGGVGFDADLGHGPPRFHQLGNGGVDPDAGHPGGLAGVREGQFDLQREVDAVSVEPVDVDANLVLTIGVEPENRHVGAGLRKGQIRRVHWVHDVRRRGIGPREVRAPPARRPPPRYPEPRSLDRTQVDDRNQRARAVGVDRDVVVAPASRAAGAATRERRQTNRQQCRPGEPACAHASSR